MTKVLNIEAHNQFGAFVDSWQRTMPCRPFNVIRQKRVRLACEQILIEGGEIAIFIKNVSKSPVKEPYVGTR